MTHPTQCRRVRELGADYLIEHRRVGLLDPTDSARPNAALRESLDNITDADGLLRQLQRRTLAAGVAFPDGQSALREAAASLPHDVAEPRTLEAPIDEWAHQVADLMLRLSADELFDPARPLHEQTSVGPLIDMLAVARLGLEKLLGESPPPTLPAAVLGRDELPTVGPGPVDVFEVGDLCDPFSADGHLMIREVLQESDVIRWRWLHGPTGIHEHSDFLAGVAEVVAVRTPERFAETIRRLYHSQDVAPYGALDEVVYDLPDSVDYLTKAARSPETRARLSSDRTICRVCAIPPVRPAFVVGRRLFIGLDKAAAIRDEADRLARVASSDHTYNRK